MPLPFRVGFLDKGNREAEVAIKTPEKKSGYEPTPEYNPTRVIVKCRECKAVGIAEFVNGFNMKDGDKLMAGRPILGICFRCRKETELVPIKLAPGKDHEMRMLYDIQRSLDESTRRGEPIDPRGVIWPLARIKAFEEWKAKNGG
jgi:hypothetical protein